MSRVEAFQRVPLGGLSYEDIEHFVEAAYNTQLSQELAEAIYARTEGNPFFMNEVIRLLQDKFQENREGTGFSLDLGIPEGVREVIRHRVGILSEQCNQMLTMASVIGREFDFNQLKAVIVDMSEVQLLDAIDEALVARVMDDAQGTTERYQFSHALIRNAIYEELSSSRRARAHAEVGEALETSYEANVKAHAAELAYHFAEAQNVIGTEKLVRYSLLASEHALDSYAYEEGLIHIERALAAKEGQPDDAEKARLLFALAIAKSATLEYHQLQEVVDAVRAAFELSVEIGEVSQALDIAEFPFATIWGNSGESDLIARALTLVEPDSQRAGRLLARYGRILQLEKNEYENAMEALRHALVIAQCGSDLALERQILGYMAVVEALQLHYRESLDVAQDVIRLAGTSGYDINSDFLGHFLATLASISIGRSGNLRFHLDPMIITADKSQHHFALTTTRYCQGIVSRLEGNLNAACEHYKHGLELGPGDVRLLHDLTIQECELGHFDQTESLLGQLLQTVRQSAIGPNLEHSCIVLTIASTSYISVDISRFDIAEASADIVLSSPFATPVAATLARIGLALIAFQQDDRDSAETLYATLLPNRGIFICQAWGRVDHVLGLLCLTMNKLDDSIVHFEDDLNFCRQAGYRPESAWTAYGYADSLVRRNGSGDHNRAISLLEEALSISSELGMRPLMEKVISLMERAKTRPTKAFAYPDGLTEREVGVLRLIANGMTDREIALELVISHRTVNNHVRSIFNKTAAVNRAEASTYATRQGLV